MTNTNKLIRHLSELYLLPTGAEDKEDWSSEFAELVETIVEGEPTDDWLGDLATRLQRLGDAVALVELADAAQLSLSQNRGSGHD